MKKNKKNTERICERNTERICESVIDDVREFEGLDRGDTFKDDKINEMSPNEIFEKWCEWNGFINYSETFRKVVGSIYGIDIDNNTIFINGHDRHKEAFLIIEEILRMIASTDNHFTENIHEYICEKLDISDNSLEDALNIMSNINIQKNRI